MSNVALLYNIPRAPRDLEEWAFANADSHNLIVVGLTKKFPQQKFDTFALYPLPQTDIPSFLLRHQFMHNQMDPVLGIGGNDYTGLNFSDPVSLEYLFTLHAVEHIQAHAALGIKG